MDIKGFIRRHPIATFLAITFVFTWVLWSVVLVSVGPVADPTKMPLYLFLLAFLSGFGPSLAGIIVTRIVKGKGSVRALLARLGQWQTNIGWYGAALLIIPLMFIVTLAIKAALGMPVPTISDVVSGAALGIIWGIFAGLGEEFGWRGYLLPELQSRYNAFVASCVIGLAWGMWHLAMDFVAIGHYGVLFIPNFFAEHVFRVTAIAILMTWVYNNTKGSMLLMVLFHASITSSAIIFSPIGQSAMDYLWQNLINGALTWLIVAIVVATAGAKRLVQERPQRR